VRVLLRFAAASLLGVAAVVMTAAVADELRSPRPMLTAVYTPSFAPVPPAESAGTTVAKLWEHLRSPDGLAFVRRALPNEAGVLWLSLLLTLVIAFDFGRSSRARNLDVLSLQIVGFLLFGILGFLDRLRRPEFVHLMDWVFSGIVAISLGLVGRAIWLVVHPSSEQWTPGLGARALRLLAVGLVVGNVAIALVRVPDDVGFFVNLGAQRLRERGALPYGDPLLTGSPGAAYGPLLYAAHVPFQLLLDPTPPNIESPDLPTLGAASTYLLPSQLATKLCAVAFHLLGVIGLFVVGRRMAGAAVAWGIVALYAGSAYVLGVGGDQYFIGGMTYISHIAPAAVMLCAFALLGAPLAAGVLLALAAGVGFYPAFMAPAWLGYYWHRTHERVRFALGFLSTAGAIGVGALLLSRPAGGRGLVGTILWDTFGHHTDPRGYGSSPFGFWGQRGGIRGWLMEPLVAESGFTTPAFLCFLSLAIGGFWLARGRRPQQLALLTGAVAIGASLLKIHPTGTYVAWYYPFLLIGLLCGPGSAADVDSRPHV
jgi:hypothetical protein